MILPVPVPGGAVDPFFKTLSASLQNNVKIEMKKNLKIGERPSSRLKSENQKASWLPFAASNQFCFTIFFSNFETVFFFEIAPPISEIGKFILVLTIIVSTSMNLVTSIRGEKKLIFIAPHISETW